MSDNTRCRSVMVSPSRSSVASRRLSRLGSFARPSWGLYQPTRPSRIEIGSMSPDCITHSFSRPSPAGGLRGRLVYAGLGCPDDFAGIDERDRVVLLESIANPAASLQPQRRAPPDRSTSVRTSISTKCASPPSGAARPKRRSASCRRRGAQPAQGRRRCAEGARTRGWGG